MLKLNVNCFMRLLTGTEAYIPPIENMKGVKYLYDNLHTPLESGEQMLIRDVDFNAFTLEDFEEFENYLINTIYWHKSNTSMIGRNLRELMPVPTKTRFI